MNAQLTVQDVIDTIFAAVPAQPDSDTVDTVKLGDPAQSVTGIVTTFLATCAVIQQAAALGANLIITHEPIFYNHRDETGWLEGDPVYQAKRRLIDEHNIVIWRFHDYWHQRRPDGIIAGVLKQLGWEAYADPDRTYLCALPPLPLGELVATLKTKLNIPRVRTIGASDMICRRVGLLVGAPGGRVQIEVLGREGLDVLICGEINEREISEYVRDAAYAGQSRALIVIGHANSEEAGMGWLAEWLRPQLPGVPITHVPAGDPLRFA
jgi:putative NIF3 family GTP cyclohydrolase 1 type 2